MDARYEEKDTKRFNRMNWARLHTTDGECVRIELIHICSVHPEQPARYLVESRKESFTYCQDCFVTVMSNMAKGRSFTVRILT